MFVEIEVTEDTVNLDVMKQTCLDGPGHYLGSDQTLSLMETDYVYPTLSDRTSPKEWVENSQPELLKNATALKEKILNEKSEAEFEDLLDNKIRSKFKIHLRK